MTSQPADVAATLPPPLPGPGLRQRIGTLFKLGVIALLTLALGVPLMLIRNVLQERLGRRGEAVAEITASWGGPQTLVGPVLSVPYTYRFTTRKAQLVNGRMEELEVEQTATATAQFLPSTLSVNGKLAPSILHRGIYEAVVYGGDLTLQGTFTRPSLAEWKVAPADIHWEDATVSFAITDLRGAQEAISLQWGGQPIPMMPGSRLAGFPQGIHGRIKTEPTADEVPFDLHLTLNGSSGIRCAPLGAQTDVRISSPWPDPRFAGAFLPAQRDVTAAGFDAAWRVSLYGRSYPQQWSTRDDPQVFSAEAVEHSLFGVDLMTVVDSYRFVERSLKYGLLLIVLVFTSFFLFEVLAPIRVHPFQYALVGFALCLFYLALLSLSELVSFGAAYGVGAAAASLLITLYCARALQRRGRALVIAAELAITYGFLFVILRLQDYSLVLGTAALFIALAIVMFATRKIDWYARDRA